jgi:hypothetical protein
MQGELDAAAQTGPVDRGDGRKRQLADAPEELMSGVASCAGQFGCRAGEFADVRAGREEVGLTGDDECGPVLRLELVQHALERAKRLTAEEGRLRVVGAVIDRHERERPVDLRQRHSRKLELG